MPDDWLALGNVWEIARPDFKRRVHYYGVKRGWPPGLCTTRQACRDPPPTPLPPVGKVIGDHGRRRWVDTVTLVAVPYDVPIPG